MPSVRDIADQTLGIPKVFDLRPPAQAAPAERRTDELEDALDFRRRALAHKLREGAMDELEGDVESARIKAEAERLKAELQLEALRQQQEEQRAQRQTGSENNILNAVLNLLTADKERLLQSNDALQAKVIEGLEAQQERLALPPPTAAPAGPDAAASGLTDLIRFMAQERQQAIEENRKLYQQMLDAGQAQTQTVYEQIMSRLQQPPAEDGNQRLATQIKELREVKELLAELAPQPATQQLATSINDVVRMHELQEQHELRMLELKRQDQIRDREYEMQMARFGLDQKRADRMASALEQLTPGIVEVIRQQTSSAPAPASAAGAAGQPAAIPAMVSLQCPTCQAPMQVQADATLAVCPNCHDMHRLVMPPAEESA